MDAIAHLQLVDTYSVRYITGGGGVAWRTADRSLAVLMACLLAVGCADASAVPSGETNASTNPTYIGTSDPQTTGDSSTETSSARTQPTDETAGGTTATTTPTGSTIKKATTTTTVRTGTTVTTATTATTPSTPAGPTYSGCVTVSLAAINAERATFGSSALTTSGNSGSCAWALAMAQANGASHGGYHCSALASQVVGSAMGSGYAPSGSEPSDIVSDWLGSPGHWTTLMNPSFHSIGLGFVTRINPDGSWGVFGVGNLCE